MRAQRKLYMKRSIAIGGDETDDNGPKWPLIKEELRLKHQASISPPSSTIDFISHSGSKRKSTSFFGYIHGHPMEVHILFLPNYNSLHWECVPVEVATRMGMVGLQILNGQRNSRLTSSPWHTLAPNKYCYIKKPSSLCSHSCIVTGIIYGMWSPNSQISCNT